MDKICVISGGDRERRGREQGGNHARAGKASEYRTPAMYSRMVARFSEVVEGGPEVQRGDLGEPMLAGGAEDEQGSNGRFSSTGPANSPSPFAITSRPSWIRWHSHWHGKAPHIHACATAG